MLGDWLTRGRETWMKVAGLVYIFADQYNILALRRAVTTSWHRLKLAPYSVVIQAYENLPESSLFRRFLVESYVWHWRGDSDIETEKQKVGDVPIRFFCSWISVMVPRVRLGKLKGSCPCCNDSCRFHEHESAEEKVRKQVITILVSSAAYAYFPLACGRIGKNKN